MAVTTSSSIADILRLRAHETPHKTAYSFLRDGALAAAFTYEELHHRAAGFAGKLRELGTQGPVLLVYPSGLEYIAAFFGCLYAGLIPVPVYPPKPNRPDARLAAVAADSQADMALSTAQIVADMACRLAQQPELQGIRWLATDTDVSLATAETPAPPTAADDTAYLQYTSGSTSSPKGVMVTHGSLLSTLEDLHRGWQHDGDSVMVSWLPLFHDMGLIYGVLQPMYNGFPAYLMDPAAFLQRPLRWLEAVSRYRATHSAAPNFAFELCVQSVDGAARAELDLRSWQMVLNAAEPVRAETLQRFSEAFAGCGFAPRSLCPGYGLAEASLKVTAVRRGAGYNTLRVKAAALIRGVVEEAGADGAEVRVLVGCGRSELGARIAIVDPETSRERAPDRIGEIWVAGESVAKGYWRRPAETQETFGARLSDTGEGPFLRTGDLGFFREGELYLTGRIKDLIIIRGANHYPQDIELTVERSHPALRPGGGAAFAVEAGGEERLVVVQELKRSALRGTDLDGVLEAIREAVVLGHALRPHGVVLLRPASVPKTSSGKIQRAACREEYLAGGLKAVAQWREGSQTQAGSEAHPPVFNRSAEAVEQWLLGRLAEGVGAEGRRLDADEPFARWGVDSLAAVRLSGELESLLGRSLPATLLFEYPSPRILARHLARDEPAGTPSAPGRPAMDGESIAVIGLACRFPGAADAEGFWRLLCEGADRAALPSPARGLGAGTRQGYFLEAVDHFDAEFFGLSPREADHMDPQQRLLLEVAWEALENAGRADLAGSNTGVFVGISASDYFRMMLEDGHSLNGHCATGGALSIAANRLSYLLDLHGPSWAVDTACSSSLVAVHQACQTLRLGECDMALAAGVNLILSPELSSVFAQAGMLAEDGRCKSFDADADGYGRGEGCGVLVLKRSADALRDGDTILALLAGSAVNQDGRSNGLTAPNGRAQQDVIRRALGQAQLPPAAIGYVETHGTGTPLGDPIELNALRAVLLEGRGQEQPCRIGSVKPNIGHLEAAAGIAGLIKTILALRHGEIPPLLHFRRMNPHIRLEGTPLSIPVLAQAWPPGRDVRVAAVSSFGFGGTNAHVIVREPEPAWSQPGPLPSGEDPSQILVLSAKQAGALTDLAGSYRAHLEAHPDQALGDVCFSANTGRASFRHRLAVLAESSGRLGELLAQAAAGKEVPGLWRGEAPLSGRPKLAFLFTGQGSQHPGMGRELYRSQPAFRRSLDRCEEILRGELEPSLLEILYGADSKDLLQRTEYAQPALFALEYSLAMLWRSWGIEATAVMGHSLGEYVAACVAGVFGLEDGLRLVARRGKLMQEAPGCGAMAAVFAPERAVREGIAPWAGEIRIAALNGPRNTVISGSSDSVAAACAAFAEQGIASKGLATSHAFHSALMEPLAEPFEALASQVAYAPPRIPLICNLTGMEASAEVASPAYWRRHLLEPVRFSAGMESLSRLGCDGFLELGPKPVLLEMGRLCLPESPAFWLASLHAPRPAMASLFASLAEWFVRGGEVDWRGVYEGQGRQRLSLPNYPFQRQRHWFRDPPAAPAAAVPPHWFHEARCLPKPRGQVSIPAQRPGNSGSWLVFDDGSGFGESLARDLETSGQYCRRVVCGTPDTDGFSGMLHVDPHHPEAVGPLIEGIAAAGPLAGIVYLWCLPEAGEPEPVGEGLERARSLACDIPAAILQALDRSRSAAKLWLVTRGLATVSGHPSLPSAAGALLEGMGKVMALEYPELWGGMVDLPASPEPGEAALLLREMADSEGEDCLAFRQGQRFAARIAPLPAASGSPVHLTQDASYLITGGLGALGLQTAQWMVRNGARHLVLVGRHQAAGKAADALRELTALGAQVTVKPCDVSKPEAVAALFRDLAEQLPPLKGIVHGAGAAQALPLRDFRPARTGTSVLSIKLTGSPVLSAEASGTSVLSAKVSGAWLLHRHSQGMDLDFFVCYSSIAAVLGAHGQAHYAAANHYLDALARYRHGLGLPTLSINWGPWAGGGMASGEYRRQLLRLGVRALSPSAAVSALGPLLAGKAPQALVADVDWQRFQAHGPTPLLADLVVSAPKSESDSPPLRQHLTQALPAERHRLLVAHLQTEVARVLGFPAGRKIDARQGFFDLGLDSLAAVELNRHLEKLLGERLPPSLAFERPDIESLASHLEELICPGAGAAPWVNEEAPVDFEPEAIQELSERELEAYVDQELMKALR